MSSHYSKERRAKRLELQLPVRIEIQESENAVRREMTHLINVSTLGASFYLKRKFAVGRLLLLIIPLPRELRFYDYLENQYAVWAIVRHCHQVNINGSEAYCIGVAFVGKYPPKSYRENPLRIYQLSNIGSDNLWKISEGEESIDNRQYQRYTIPINVYIAIFDETENIVAHERTVTENISLGGAAVFSNLPVKVGDLVKMVCDQYNVSMTAEVRHLRKGEDGLPRLHLKFVDQEFPLQGIEQM